MLLRQRWILGATVFLLVLVPLVSVVFTLPDVYRSGSTILIEPQQISDDLVKSTITGTLDTRLSSVEAQVLSGASLTKLIRCFGLYDFKQVKSFCEARFQSEDVRKDFVAEAVRDRMREDVTIEPLRGDDVDEPTVGITISYRGSQPQTVADVTNALTSSYILENERMRSVQAYGTADFLARQAAEAAAKLQAVEKAIGDVTSKHIGELPAQLEANLKALEELDTHLRVNSESMIEATERSGDPEADVQVKRLQAEAADLERQLAVYHARVEASPRVQQQFQFLAREHESAYQAYRSIAARQREAELAAQMEDVQKGERFRVIERAIPSENPVAPQRARFYALALVVALAAASLVVLVSGWLNNRFGRSVASLADDGLPQPSLPLT